jgi:hypothetical protein
VTTRSDKGAVNLALRYYADMQEWVVRIGRPDRVFDAQFSRLLENFG